MEVEIKGGDLETAIHRLKRFMSQDGILTEIKLREKYPNRRDWKKAKGRQARRRRLKVAKKAEIARRQENSYDRIGRRQDQANRVFHVRRAPAPVGGNR